MESADSTSGTFVANSTGLPAASSHYDQAQHCKVKRCQNPYIGMTEGNVVRETEALWERHLNNPQSKITKHEFIRGCLVGWAKEMSPSSYHNLRYITEKEKTQLRDEDESPMKLACSRNVWFAALICAGSAIVQGMDQTIINGAQIFYFAQFGVAHAAMKGFVNGSPYIVAALTGPWVNTVLNSHYGRLGTLYICCVICFLTAIGQSLSTNVWVLIAFRMLLGLAVSPMSATVPIYCAEVAPAKVRGRLGMLWQTFTAFGIMIGIATSLGLNGAEFPDSSAFGRDNQWRLMFGLTGVPPVLVMIMIHTCAESPRWYINNERLGDAWTAFRKLRTSNISAARDYYAAYKSWHAESAAAPGMSAFQLLRKTWRERRTFLSMLSAYYVMLTQQFCGINAIAYYSTDMFMGIGYSRQLALLFSFGFGGINFSFAALAWLCIDRFGRRPLLLWTMPIMSACLFVVAGCSELGGQVKMATMTTFMYAFTALYSVGAGPVTFGYAAEVFPLQTKAFLMATATSLTWLFNFVVSFSWPPMSEALGVRGAFSVYATFCGLGWLIGFFFMRETKQKSLEEMDVIFSVRARDFAADRGRYLIDTVTCNKKKRPDIFEQAWDESRARDGQEAKTEPASS